MHSALLVIDIPKRNNPEWKLNWQEFSTAVNKILGSTAEDYSQATNVWLIDLAKGFFVFSTLSSLASEHGLEHHILFLNEDPTWIKPQVREVKDND